MAKRYSFSVDQFDEVACVTINDFGNASTRKVNRSHALSALLQLHANWEVRVDLDEEGRPLTIEIVRF